MRCDCNRCLEPAEFPIDSTFDPFLSPAETANDEDQEEVENDDGEAGIAFYEGAGMELKMFCGSRFWACRKEARWKPDRGPPSPIPDVDSIAAGTELVNHFAKVSCLSEMASRYNCSVPRMQKCDALSKCLGCYL